jgi:hypothetical protein
MVHLPADYVIILLFTTVFESIAKIKIKRATYTRTTVLQKQLYNN